MANQAWAQKSMYSCELGSRKQRSKRLVGGNSAVVEGNFTQGICSQTMYLRHLHSFRR